MASSTRTPPEWALESMCEHDQDSYFWDDWHWTCVECGTSKYVQVLWEQINTDCFQPCRQGRLYSHNIYLKKILWKLREERPLPRFKELDEVMAKYVGVDRVNWYQFYKDLKRIDCEEFYFAGAGWLCKKATDHVWHLTSHMSEIYDEFAASCSGKNRPNVWYVLFKISECTDNALAHWIPLKLRQTTLNALDKQWKAFCENHNLKFKPTKAQR